MKVVIFCGGYGTRLREHSDTIPKPLVTIGYRPILWHLMKYYAHYGHKEFILCLGYRGDMIKEYFLNYNPYLSENVIIDHGGKLTPNKSDIADWRIHLVDTGMNTNIGGRLMAVRDYLGDDEVFLASYGDQLTDLPLDEHIRKFRRIGGGAPASWRCIRRSRAITPFAWAEDGLVTEIVPMARLGSLDQRWLHGASQRDLRLHGARRRARRSTLFAAWWPTKSSPPSSIAASGRPWIPSRTR